MVNQIGDNGNTPKKLQELAKKLIEPNAAIRVGRSVITQITNGSLDLVINNTFISLIPDVEAVYFIDLKTQQEKQELSDCILYLWDIPDNGIGVSQMSKAGYTWIVSDESAFLSCTYGINETHRIYTKKYCHEIDENHFLTFDNGVVKDNPSGGIDLIADNIYVSFNIGVKAAYFMSESLRKEMDEHARSNWWDLFCDVTEDGIAVVQRSKAGFTWWIYDEKAYTSKCERNGGVDPTQFKISPNRAF